MPFSPLTLTLSPKGRGKINFDNTSFIEGREGNDLMICPLLDDQKNSD
jgi:hypothetical protein